MIGILGWILFGLIVGVIAKLTERPIEWSKYKVRPRRRHGVKAIGFDVGELVVATGIGNRQTILRSAQINAPSTGVPSSRVMRPLTELSAAVGALQHCGTTV